MRLSHKERTIITDTIHHFDPGARIILFGSRTDDMKKGGDIDLFILSYILSSREKRAIKMRLDDLLGEQKIDMLIEPEPKSPIGKIAVREGIEL